MPRTGSPSHRRPLPAVLAVAIGVALACGLAGTTPAAASPPAATGSPAPAGSPGAAGSAPPRAVRADCPPVPLWANTGGATQSLIEYDTTGTVLASAPLVRDYGDIAFAPDGSKLYGVSFPDAPVLYTIDPATGAETASVAITGPLAELSPPAANGLTARSDGMLITGSFVTNLIYLVDPATGVSTLAPYAFPDGFVSAGDFLTLADGDVLAFASPAGAVMGTPSPVFRIHPDNTVTRIGTVPQTFGAAQSGGSVYAFASDGTIDRLDSVPTAPSTDPLPVTTVSATGSGFYGATAPQDSSSCVTPAYTIAKGAAPAGPVDEGATVTYTVTVTNTGTVAANADFTDDLAAVLDDATLVPGSVSASTGAASVTGTTLTYTGVVNPSATATVSYQVTVNTPDTGDRALTNSATPTGQGGSCATQGGCTTTVAVNVPTRGVTVVKSATEQVFTAAGQVLHYGYLVTNTGSQPLTGVTVTDQGPGTPTVTCPDTVLAAGASTTCTAQYTTTAADVQAGRVVNTATATGSAPGGTPVTGTSNQVTVPYGGVTVVKKAKEKEFSAAGETLHYTFTVTNTGTVPVSGVTVTDQGPGTPTVTCPVTVLAPGASTTCTARYKTTAADVHAGKVTDHATVTATTPDGTTVTATSNTVTVPTCKPGEHPWTPGHGEDPVSVQPAHWVTGHDDGTQPTAIEGPEHPGALPDTGTDGARRAATGAGALVTLGFAALATRYDRTRGTGRS
ncbi:DUF7507 domain-containing protein [Kitasatospora purpeofusca]|uniref:DUF7507 domain-containing protein n=1 Tax=Kitasatospora purpeofusca TaxID=67352 RepID=UPI0036552E76